MSGCGDVCIDWGDSFDSTSTVLVRGLRRARKDHVCDECRCPIQRGTEYDYYRGICDGEFLVSKTCLDCADIVRAFVCGPFVVGDLWSEIAEVMFPVWTDKGPLDCLAKLERATARDLCRERYRQWVTEHRPWLLLPDATEGGAT